MQVLLFSRVIGPWNSLLARSENFRNLAFLTLFKECRLLFAGYISLHVHGVCKCRIFAWVPRQFL